MVLPLNIFILFIFSVEKNNGTGGDNRNGGSEDEENPPFVLLILLPCIAAILLFTIVLVYFTKRNKRTTPMTQTLYISDKNNVLFAYYKNDEDEGTPNSSSIMREKANAEDPEEAIELKKNVFAEG